MAAQTQTPISNRGFAAQKMCTIPYYHPLQLDGITASIDSVRMKYTFQSGSYDYDKNERCDTLVAVLNELNSDRLWSEHLFDVHFIETSFKIGNYKHTVTFDLADGNSFAVLVGRFEAAGNKQVAPEAVLDFNPNKIPPRAWQRVAGILFSWAQKVEVQRFDLAMDFPIDRDFFRLIKRPGSQYKLFSSTNDALTEYIGERSKHGAVKLYDKQKEHDPELEYPCTRLEITIEKSKYKRVHDLIPRIQSLAPMQYSISMNDLPFEIQSVLIHPDLYDRLMQSVNRNTRTKYRKMLDSVPGAFFRIEDSDLDQIDRYVRAYIAQLPTAHLQDPT